MQKLELINKLNESKVYMKTLQDNYNQVVQNNAKLLDIISTEKQKNRLALLSKARAQSQAQPPELQLPILDKRNVTPQRMIYDQEYYTNPNNANAIPKTANKRTITPVPNRIQNELANKDADELEIIPERSERKEAKPPNTLPVIKKKALNLSPSSHTNDLHSLNEIKSLKNEFTSFLTNIKDELHSISNEIKESSIKKATENKVNDILNDIQNEEQEINEQINVPTPSQPATIQSPKQETINPDTNVQERNIFTTQKYIYNENDEDERKYMDDDEVPHYDNDELAKINEKYNKIIDNQ